MGDPHAEKKPEKKPSPLPAQTTSGVLLEIAIVIFVVLFIVIPLLGYLSPSFSGQSGIRDVALDLLRRIKTISTVVSMVAIGIAVYSLVHIFEIASAETKKLGLALSWHTERKQKNVRWERIEAYMTSLSRSDWKIAILEADNILDEVVERMGYKGETLGERMKQIEPSDFPYLDEAWNAHKVRNAIAHKGTDYELTRSEAEQTINIYHRIFKELGYL